MIKLLDILLENDSEKLDILVPRRNKEDRQKNYINVVLKQVQNYIKNGSVGNLNLYYIPITELPDNLTKVGRHLFLNRTQIQKLPNNLTVNGTLDLRETPITELPDNLSVGGDLYLSYSRIKTPSKNISVGGSLYLRGTPLEVNYTRDELRQMFNVKGDIYRFS